MSRMVDKEIVVGFIEEAKSYLPAILQGIEDFAENSNLELLEEAHRHAHTIKGASSMIGLAGLSHIAYYVEETLEELGKGQLTLDDAIAAWLYQTVMQIEGYLDGFSSGTLDEAPILAEVTLAYRRLRGLPAEEDEIIVAEILSKIESSPKPTLVDASPPPPITTDDIPPELLLDDDDDFFDDFDEIPPELMEAFFLEAEDHMRIISLAMTELSKNPDQKEYLDSIRRSAHTLKGAAGTVGVRVIAELTHRMEDMLDLLHDEKLDFNEDIMTLLFASSDALEDMITGEEVEADVQQVALKELYAQYDLLLDQSPVATPKIEPLGEEKVIDLAEMAAQLQKATQQSEKDETVATKPTTSTAEKETKGRREAGEVLRVPIERLDELTRLVGELVITRTAFEQRMRDLVHEVEELRPSIERLRHVSTRLETEYEVSTLGGGMAFTNATQAGLPTTKQPAYTESLHSIDFDELEFDRYTEFHLLSRELAETTNDVNIVGNSLGTLIGDFDSVLNRQSRLSSELQEKLMRVRMVPLGMLSTRLHRAVRVVARQQDKAVDLIIEGEEIELDKTVLEEMADPLLHILRNAVDHGIEPPALRHVMGKPERGRIELHAYHEGNQVVIQITDDGAGIEPDIIRAKAVSEAYISEAEAVQMSDEALHSMLFLPGFSTAGQVSEISGRGVGLDVVKANVHKLKGTMTLDSTPGEGTTFTIRLPMTMAVTRALLVKANNETFAIPLGAISQIMRMDTEEFEKVGQETVVRVGGKVYPLMKLGEILRLKQPPDETVLQRQPVLILNAGGKQVAIVVDHIIQGREIVIKTLGNHLRRVYGITGATLMGDGSVVLILNPAELIDEPASTKIESWTPLRKAAERTRKVWNIMIVDDSVSVRRVVSSLIKNAGWQPTTAKDGLEALEILQRSPQPPDLMLLDIEMPRMDGYELTATLRGQTAFKNLPIVMLTSRAGEKHRRKAVDIGVSEYVVKPYRDENLLNIIRQLVQDKKAVEDNTA